MSKIPKYVSTKKDLAEYVSCSERKLYDHMKRPGNPGQTSSGKYNVEKWIEFISGVQKERLEQVKMGQAATGAGNEAILQARIQNMELKNQVEQQKLAEMRGQTITIEEHHDELTELASIVNAAFTQVRNEVDVRIKDADVSRRTADIINRALGMIRERVEQSESQVDKAQRRSK